MKRIVVVSLASMALGAMSATAFAQQSGQQGQTQPGQAQPMQAQPNQGQQMGGQAGMTGQPVSVDRLSQDQIRDLQRALRERGHDLEVDGQWGPETQAALRAFKQRQNIQGADQDRQISRQTISALGLNMERFGGDDAVGAGSGGNTGTNR